VVLTAFDTKRRSMEELIPDLQALYKKSPGKPVVKFYEGVPEVGKIFDAITAMEGDLLCAFASLTKLFTLMPEIPTRVQRAVKEKKIIFQEIVTPESAEAAEKARGAMTPFHEYRVLPEKYADFPTDILVWDDSVALITLAEPVFGVVITSKPLADTYRLHFEMMWEGLKKQDRI
jgi:HTH-type transcriptional regulator, sugar sensing transcriptional regulator